MLIVRGFTDLAPQFLSNGKDAPAVVCAFERGRATGPGAQPAIKRSGSRRASVPRVPEVLPGGTRFTASQKCACAVAQAFSATTAKKTIGRIRLLVTVNLILGLATVVVGASGRYF